MNPNMNIKRHPRVVVRPPRSRCDMFLVAFSLMALKLKLKYRYPARVSGKFRARAAG